MKIIIALLISVAVCAFAANKTESINTNQYSLNLPSHIKHKVYYKDKFSNVQFYINNIEVGGVVHYSYKDADKLKSLINENISNAFSKFFDEIGMENFRNPLIDQMGGDSLYGDFEMWFGSGVKFDTKVDEIHYFYIVSDNSIYDLWFNRVILSDEDEKNIIQNFSLYKKNNKTDTNY